MSKRTPDGSSKADSNVVGSVPEDRNPFDLLWEMREKARAIYGDDFADDAYPDEPIRRTVGRRRSQSPN